MMTHLIIINVITRFSSFASSHLSLQFNISIDDYPEVVEDTKRALNLVSGDSIVQRFPLSVEISLRTTEGDSMVLEVWSLGLSVDRCDSTVRASHTIYNRMSILLKSLISVSRVTPAYKLSRRQSADSYQILYRIYVGEPEIHCLGECRDGIRMRCGTEDGDYYYDYVVQRMVGCLISAGVMAT